MNKQEFLEYYYKSLLLGLDIIIDGAIYVVLDDDIVVLKSYDENYQDENIVIPEFVDVIGSNCFYNNHKIKEIHLSNVSKIEENAFDSSGIHFVLDSNNLKYIANGAFRFSELEYIDLSTVDVIEKRAFSGCHNLKNVVFKDDVYIGKYSFKNTGLYSIKLKTKLLYKDTFSFCFNLLSVNIEADLIQDKVFDNCFGLKYAFVSSNCIVEDKLLYKILNGNNDINNNKIGI